MKAISALDRKLLRDLWHLRGQAIAVGIIVACAVAIMIMALGTLSTLKASRDAYYQKYRFAEIFASARRVPESLIARLREIDGVQTVEARIVRMVILRVPGLDEPANAQIVSLPDDSESTLNRIVLFSGRYPVTRSANEVVISRAFSEANGLDAGDTVDVVINGRLRTLSIVGVGDSPEFIYAMSPGSLLPDDRLFGIFWMRRQPLEAAFDLNGAFNNVTFSIAPSAKVGRIISEVDDILAPYGGTGAIDRSDQISNAFIESEMGQLRTLARIIPAVFLVVSSILINSILSRLIQTERQQIGLIKAFGYSRSEIAWHYMKLAIAITAGGILAGFALGFFLENVITRTYAEVFRIPDLAWRVDFGALVVSAASAMGAAIFGALFTSLGAARLPPAEAMSPEPPISYNQVWLSALLQVRNLDEPTRLILRHMFRFPWRTAANLFGIAASVMLLIGTLFAFDSVQEIMDRMFYRANTHDAAVSFFEARNDTVLQEIGHLPGAMAVEGVRDVPARISSGPRSERTAITGITAGSELRRLLNKSQELIVIAPGGIALSSALAGQLGVGTGDIVNVDILDGTRPVVSLPVISIVEEPVGTPAFLELSFLNSLMSQPTSVSGALLKLDPNGQKAFRESILDRPGIAGVSFRSAAITAFEGTLQETIYIMMAIYAVIGGSIAGGVVYNAARIGLTERGRELASLRVLGFTNTEVGYILLGELALIVLVAVPLGAISGIGLAHFIAASMATELYRIPVRIDPSTIGFAATIVIFSSSLAALFVVQRVRSLDLIAVLKTRE